MYYLRMQKSYTDERKSFFSGREFGWWVALFIIVDVLLSTIGIIIAAMMPADGTALGFSINDFELDTDLEVIVNTDGSIQYDILNYRIIKIGYWIRMPKHSCEP